MSDVCTMLTVDLYDVSDDQRDTFYETLAKLQWDKIDGVTTTWVCGYGQVNTNKMSKDAHDDVQKAAWEANLEADDYDYAFFAGEGIFYSQE